jgi:hypothetical protein
MTEHHISKECKLFKDCPFCWDCLYEMALTGGPALWSLELCYDLKALIDQGLVSMGNQTEMKIAYFMVRTFGEHHD